MNDVINFFTVIPWILYFCFRVIDALKGTKKQKFNLKWFKNNWKKIFHLEEILLMAIFVYFSSQGDKNLNKFLYQMLFVVMNLYLFINSFYDRRRTIANNLNKKDLSVIIITSLFLIMPFLYYIKVKELVLTYYLLFVLVFFSYPIVLISRLIDFIIRKIINKK